MNQGTKYMMKSIPKEAEKLNKNEKTFEELKQEQMSLAKFIVVFIFVTSIISIITN